MGGSLHDLIKTEPMSVEHARALTLELCDALIRSHHLNIVHRDIKPENVLLTEDGKPKLADFGVARSSEGTRMTRTRELISFSIDSLISCALGGSDYFCK